MNIQSLNRYAEGAYLSLLLGHALDPKFIENDIRVRYQDPVIVHMVNDMDYSVIIETERRVVIAFAGTKNTLGWAENLIGIVARAGGIHLGYELAFMEYNAKRIADFIKNKVSKPVVCYGYSQGAAKAVRCGLFLREVFMHSDCEAYSFCGPTLFDKTGVSRAKKAKLRCTTVRGTRDIVDDVGEWFGGKQYGYQVWLPAVGTNFIDGHFYHNFAEAMWWLFKSWKKQDEMNFIKSVSHLATC